MKKALFIHRYGRDFKYSVSLVEEKMAESAKARMFDTLTRLLFGMTWLLKNRENSKD